jgi:hypothetical protein
MKYVTEIEINLPREKVVELFDNQDNMIKWQPGLMSCEPISGNPGEEGAKSILKYRMGDREVEMIETITKRALPDEISGIYEAKGVWNQAINSFIEINPDKTMWKIESEFVGKGFMKLMMLFMPGMFKKQTLKDMNNFKKFAETSPLT